jgi:hypothetical protein
MHIILQNLQNQYYKYKLKERVLLISIYQLVRQKLLQKLKYKKYKRKRWTSFDEFKDLQFGIWKVTLSDNGSEWQHGICNGPSFFKQYICKHIVVMSIRLKFCRPPSAAKDIPLGEKRKRERPRKATKALLT